MGKFKLELGLEFERLLSEGGESADVVDTQFALDTIRRNVPLRIVQPIKGWQRLPNTYEEWKKAIIQIDEQFREADRWEKGRSDQNQYKKGGKYKTYQSNQYQNTMTVQQTQQQAPQQSWGQQQTATGTTFTGQGQPMDIDCNRLAQTSDRKCRKCGVKQSEAGTCGDRWHIPNRRSQPRQQVRYSEQGVPQPEAVRSLYDWSPEQGSDQFQGRPAAGTPANQQQSVAVPQPQNQQAQPNPMPQSSNNFESKILRFMQMHPERAHAMGFGFGPA